MKKAQHLAVFANSEIISIIHFLYKLMQQSVHAFKWNKHNLNNLKSNNIQPLQRLKTWYMPLLRHQSLTF